MARRYLAVAEARLGVQFPDSYSAALRTLNALTDFPLGELWAPAECQWIEDSNYSDDQPARTILVVGFFQRGDARPLVMIRASADVPELDPALYVLRAQGLEQVAASLTAAMSKR